MKNVKECKPSGLDASRTYASNISAQPDTKLETEKRTTPYVLYVRSCLPTFRDSLSDPSSTIKRVSKFGSKLYFMHIFMSITLQIGRSLVRSQMVSMDFSLT